MACVAQCVAELVGRDVADAGRGRDLGDRTLDATVGDPAAAFDEQVLAAQRRRSGCQPRIKELLQLGMQGDVAVRAELADRHVQPVGRANLDDGVDRQVQELALAKTGPSEELHRQADERVRVVAGRLQQLGCRGVIEETWQGAVAQWKVTSEYQDPGGDVVASPLRQPLEACAEAAEMLSQADSAQVPATCGGAFGQMQFVDLDVPTGKVRHAGDACIVPGDKDGKSPKRSLDAVHRGRAQGEADLLDIGAQGGGQSGWNRGPLRFAPVGFVGMQLAWRDVGDAEVEERRFGAEQRGGQLRARRASPADGGGDRRSAHHGRTPAPPA